MHLVGILSSQLQWKQADCAYRTACSCIGQGWNKNLNTEVTWVFLLQSQGSSPDNVYGKSHLDDFDFVDVEGDMEAEMVRGIPRQRKKDVLEEG